MRDIADFFVPWLKGQKMYFSPHIDLAWRRPELHRLMSNENPNPPSDKVIEAILKYAKMANRYADQGFAVRGKLAEMNGLPGIENVLLGNGSSEVYDMILRSFLQPGDEVIQHTPCFGIYKLRTLVAGGKMVSVPMKYKWGDEHLQYDPDGILKAITPKTKVIIVANPNNPTGNFMDAAHFERIAQTGIPFIVDEAYVEFQGEARSRVSWVMERENLIVLRTFSKRAGLAGLPALHVLLQAGDQAPQDAVLFGQHEDGTPDDWGVLGREEVAQEREERRLLGVEVAPDLGPDEVQQAAHRRARLRSGHFGDRFQRRLELPEMFQHHPMLGPQSVESCLCHSLGGVM